MDLRRIAGPLDWKREAQALRRNEGYSWDADSLRVWFGNALPSYLWQNGWKDYANSTGCSWPQFLKVMSKRKGDIILWARGGKRWEELLESVYRELRG